MRYVVPAALILVALIHLAPLPGVLGGERLVALALLAVGSVVHFGARRGTPSSKFRAEGAG